VLGKDGALTGDDDPATGFNGIDGHVGLPSALPSFSTGFTIEAWARPTNDALFGRIVDLANGPASDNIIVHRLWREDKIALTVWQGGTQVSQLVAPAGSLVNNSWQHFVATLSPTGATAIYRNGTLVASGTSPMPRNLVRTANYIGRSNWTTDEYFGGDIDDVALYDHALTAAQAALHYSRGGTNDAAATTT
jgi:hypothetical protein